MHNIQNIRKDPDIFLKKLNNRNVNLNLKSLLDLDIKNRDLIQKKEKLEQEKKIISKKRDEAQFSRSKKISSEINNLDNELSKIQKKVDVILSELPNIALDDVPIGKDESSNKEIKKIGEIPKFNFKIKSHYEIGKNLNLMDFDAATNTSGARFVFLKGKLLYQREPFLISCQTAIPKNLVIKKYLHL